MRILSVLLCCAVLSGCSRSEEKAEVDCGEAALTKKCDATLKSCRNRGISFNPASGVPVFNPGPMAACYKDEFEPDCGSRCKKAS